MRKTLFVLLMIFSGILSYGSERIISLAPAVTEILYYIGAQKDIVGVTTACDYPEEAKLLEKVGDFVNPSLEKIVSLKPTIVIGMDLNDKKMARFGALGIKYINLRIKKTDDVTEAIKTIGSISGYEKNGKYKAKIFKEEIYKYTEMSKNKKTKPRVFTVVWDSPLMTAGKESLISDIIDKAGGVNIADNLMEAYPIYSIEQVLEKKPDFIITDKKANIDKIKGKSIVIDDIDIDLILRPGPRTISAIEILYEKFDKYEKK